MEIIEVWNQKIENDEDFSREDILYFKEHLTEILSMKNGIDFLAYVSKVDIEFVKNVVLEQKVQDEDFVGSLCFYLGDDSFFENVVQKEILKNPLVIAEYLAIKKRIGKNALLCIKDWKGSREEKGTIQTLLHHLKTCKDITFHQYLNAIFYYATPQDSIDMHEISSLIRNAFSPSAEVKNFTLSNEDMENYELLIAHFMHYYTVDSHFVSHALEHLKEFPCFQECASSSPMLVDEILHFFDQHVDLSIKENQMILAEVIDTHWEKHQVTIENRLEMMENLINDYYFLEDDVYEQLLGNCHGKLNILQKDAQDVKPQIAQLQKIIATLLQYDTNLHSASMVKIAQLANLEHFDTSMEYNQKNELSDYASFVLAILHEKTIEKRIRFIDQIDLVASTRNVVAVRYILERIQGFSDRNPDLKYMELFNGCLARAIIRTNNDALIMEQYQKGIIDLSDYSPRVMEAQGFSKEQLIEKLENERESLSENEQVKLIMMLPDQNLIKQYIEKVDLPPTKMASMILAFRDETYVKEYLNHHKEMDIHLKYLLAQSLSDKSLIHEMDSHMLKVDHISEISLEELMQNDQYQYVMVGDEDDHDRDVRRILGTNDIYSREKMIQILQKVNALLEDIPYASDEREGDLIEESIIFKKIYEKYAKNTEYDEEAIQEDHENDWRRRVKCRNLEGAFLDGLVVCSGDSFCLKNLLSMRGLHAYMTHGDDQYRSEAGHAWNTIRLGEFYFKFDGTNAREKTKENGYLAMSNIQKAHGDDDEYRHSYRILQSSRAIQDEKEQHLGQKRVGVEIE